MASDEKKFKGILDKHQKYLDAIHDGIVEGTEEGIKKGTAKGVKRAAWDVLKEECLPQGFMNVSASDIEDIVRNLWALTKSIDGEITKAANKIIEKNVKQYRNRLVVDIIKKFRGQKPELAFVLELITQRENKVGELISERLPNNPISSGIVKGVQTALRTGIDRSTQGFRNELKDKLEGVENLTGESQDIKTAQRVEQIKADSKSITRDAVAKVVEEIIYRLLKMLHKRVLARLRKELGEKLIHKLEQKIGEITKQKMEQLFEKSTDRLIEEIGKDCVNDTSFVENIDKTFGNSAKECLKSQTKWLTLAKTLVITVIIVGGGIGGGVVAWPNPTYTLSIDVSGGGTTNPSPGSHTYDEGTNVTITASPDSGWEFDQWGDDAAGVSITTTIDMDSDKSVTAYFTTEIPTTRYTLTMSRNGNGVTDPPVGSWDYPDGTEITITAIPDNQWQFVNWTGDVTNPNSATTTVTMDFDKTIIANFSEAPIAFLFADLDWDSAQVHNRIAAFILEHGYGYEIEYMFGSTIPMFVGLTTGDIDISMEIWVENQQAAYDEAIAAGQVVDLGSNFLDAWQGWLVPTYMIEEGLLPADISVYDMPYYWELFKDPEDLTKGRFYSCIPGWECELINAEKMSVYGLDEYYNIFVPGSSAALLASLGTAYEKHEPWFGYWWEPTSALGKYDMTKVGEPAYDEAVWNTNHGCAYPPMPVNIVVNASLPDRAPDAVEFLRNYETTTTMINELLAYMDDNDASTGEAAIYFLQNYESVWTQWVSADVASKIKAALP